MRDYLQELANIEGYRREHTALPSIDKLVSNDYSLLFQQPMHLERWQDKPSNVVSCKIVSAKEPIEDTLFYFPADPIKRGEDYQEGLPSYYFDHDKQGEQEPLGVPYYVYLGAFGGKPTFSGIFSLVAFRLVEETGSDKDPKELAKAISENNFNDYADILTTIQASRPPRKNQPTYKDLCEEALARLEQVRGFFEQGGVDKLKAFKKENGIELDKFPWNDEKALNEVLKNNETAQEVTYKALSLAYFLGSLGATIKGEKEETAHLKEELALLASKDPKAMGRASIYEGLLPTKEATAHRERQPIVREADFNAPSNNVFSDLGKLFPLFKRIVTEDNQGNAKKLSKADSETIAKAKAYEEALAKKQEAIADIKAKMKAKRDEINQEKEQTYPDAIKIAKLESEFGELSKSREGIFEELKELSTNLLPFEGNSKFPAGYYCNANTLSTHINDNGEVELSTGNTTITMPKYVAVGESMYDAGTAKDIQRAILAKTRETKSAEGFFSNEEIYEIMLGKVCSLNSALQTRKNAKQDFLDYLDYLQKTFIVNTKVMPSAKDKRATAKESPLIKGHFLSSIAVDPYKGVRFSLNKDLYQWAIMTNTSYTSIDRGIMNLRDHTYRNALAYLYNQEAQNGAGMERKYTYKSFYDNMPDLPDPTKVDPSHKSRELQKPGKIYKDLKEMGLVFDEKHDAKGFSAITTKGKREAERRARAKAKKKAKQKPNN
jgi:hypothetical protein